MEAPHDKGRRAGKVGSPSEVQGQVAGVGVGVGVGHTAHRRRQRRSPWRPFARGRAWCLLLSRPGACRWGGAPWWPPAISPDLLSADLSCLQERREQEPRPKSAVPPVPGL